MDFGMRVLTEAEEEEEKVALILLDFAQKTSLLPSAFKICDSKNSKKKILRKRAREIPSELSCDFPLKMKWSAKRRRTMMPSNTRHNPAVVAASVTAAAAAPTLLVLPNVVSQNEKCSSINHTPGSTAIQKEQTVAHGKEGNFMFEALLPTVAIQLNGQLENENAHSQKEKHVELDKESNPNRSLLSDKSQNVNCQEEELCEELFQLSKKRKILANVMTDALRFCEQVSTYYEQLHQRETEVESKLLRMQATRHGAECG